MIKIEKISDKAYHIVVSDQFNQADAERLVEFASESTEASAGSHLLIDVTAISDFTWPALGVEFKHMPTLMKFIYRLDRIAVVSDEAWVRTGARFESALLPGVVYEVYDEDEAGAARAWVLEESEGPHAGAVKELDLGKSEIAAFELSGRLDREESERGIAMVRARLENPDCNRLLLIIRNWHGFDVDRLFSKDVLAGKLDIARKLERYAIVGGPRWVRNYAEFTRHFVNAEIKAFEPDEKREAIAWLEEKESAALLKESA
ncbi:SpoIIAA family protein [Parerythrobacter jejuensis]|uniref:STAS/SEC14 domain-containing protein n=1 Tax=Parerythrobacter jejuensis TaxID=795812 RepID=A0A845B472_9SPHN|nr:STAS/SEC14 domain-containing protein [Parerythrobacter jejuensis]MXP31008.1 hypothetical protein [Parerythrobacter jejuensis]MXP33768.1 hypothetical protein [Parerythrobacter jejuensis]